MALFFVAIGVVPVPRVGRLGQLDLLALGHVELDVVERTRDPVGPRGQSAGDLEGDAELLYLSGDPTEGAPDALDAVGVHDAPLNPASYLEAEELTDEGARRAEERTLEEVDMCITCLHPDHMSKMIQIRHVPDPLHRELKARAARAGMSLSDYLLQIVRRATERVTPEEMRDRLDERAPVSSAETPAEAVRAERNAR